MKIQFITLAFLAANLITNQSYALEFQCEVKSRVFVNNDGTAKVTEDSQKLYSEKNGKFLIDDNTGKITPFKDSYLPGIPTEEYFLPNVLKKATKDTFGKILYLTAPDGYKHIRGTRLIEHSHLWSTMVIDSDGLSKGTFRTWNDIGHGVFGSCTPVNQ